MAERVCQLSLLDEPEQWTWAVGRPRPVRMGTQDSAIGRGQRNLFIRKDSREIARTSIHECGHALACFLTDTEIYAVSLDRHVREIDSESVLTSLGRVQHNLIPRSLVGFYQEILSLYGTPLHSVLIDSNRKDCIKLLRWRNETEPFISAAGIAAECLARGFVRRTSAARFIEKRLDDQSDGDTANLKSMGGLPPLERVQIAVGLLAPYTDQLKQLAQLLATRREIPGPEFEQACRILDIAPFPIAASKPHYPDRNTVD